jgi:hypothetical protein
MRLMSSGAIATVPPIAGGHMVTSGRRMDDPESYASAARILRDRRQFDRLRTTAMAWALCWPSDGAAYRSLGDACLGLGANDAAAAFGRSVRLGHATPAALERLARVRLQRSEPEAARNAAAGALVLAPGQPRQLRTLANTAFRANDDRECLRALRRCGEAIGAPPARLTTRRRVALPRLAAERGWPCRTVMPPRRVDVPTGTAQFGTLGYGLARSVIVTAHDVDVLPDGGLLTDDAWAADGVLPYSPAAMNGLLDLPGARRPGDDKVPIELPDATATFEEPALLIGGDRNFGHWLSHWLSKLHVIESSGMLHTDRPVLVSHDTPPVIVELMELLGVARTRLRKLAPATITRLRHADIPSLTHIFNRMAPSYLAWLQSKTRAWRPVERPADRRIFLSRGSAAVRAIANEAEVFSRLSACGFEVVQPETLGIVEQIELFANAAAIVGTVGSGFGAVLFA